MLPSSAAVLLTVWHDTAHGGTPVSSELQPSIEWEVQGSLLSSAELTTTVTVDETARYTFDCDEVRHTSVILWLDDHLLCGTTELFAPGPGSAAPFPPWVVLHAGEPHFLRLRAVHNETTSSRAGVALRWRKNGGAAEALPASILSPPSAMPGTAARAARDELQRAVGSGWGSWYRPSALAATLLPEGSTLTAGLCRLSTRSCLDPSALFTPEQDRGQEEPKANATGRPGPHAYDRSFWSLSLQYDGGNVSLEWSGTNSGAGASAIQELDLVATLIGDVNVTDYALLVSASFVWHRVGTAAAINEGSAIRLNAAGLRSTTARALTPVLPPRAVDGSASQPVYMALAFGVGGAPATAVVTSDVDTNVTADAVVARVRKARGTAVAQYAPKIAKGTDLAEAVVAMGSCLMWNVIYHPTQLGPFVSVSRSFTQMPYELFEWDTYFGALMLSSSPYGLPIALSSMIQITKSKTVGPNLDLHGFVPGYSKGGRWLSEDRTERPIGALMVLKIFNRWHGVGGRDLRWILELLYGDLLDWHDWLWAKRRLPPLDLAVPGSNSCIFPNGTSSTDGGKPSLWCKKSWGMGELQGARFESLDNSPMYDVPGDYPLWNETLELMQLYDVGQSSAIVWECEALGVIATLLEKPSDSSKLKKRGEEMASLIAAHMWLPSPVNIFTNVMLNGTAYPRFSPTSFYPMLAGIASDAQATALITDWLTNADKFCVPRSASAAAWPPKNATVGKCYWGLPSISADDPVYSGTTGYWRGPSWTPQSFLVFLGLRRYSHLLSVKNALEGLVRQQLDLLLSVWRPHHHVCENYPSSLVNNSAGADPKTVNSCTGNQFYIWGGLPALAAMVADGFYE